MRIRTLADRAYTRIEEMIVSRELEPASLVSESQLVSITGFGRTPVREALARLARDGLIEIHPSKGAFIPDITVEAELETLEVRRPLERLSVELACGRARPDDLAGMNKMVDLLRRDGLSLDEYSLTIRDTHNLITHASGNRYLVSAMRPLQSLSRRFWLAHVVDQEQEIRTGSHYHLSLLQAILDSDKEAGIAASLGLNDYLHNFARSTLI